MGCISANISLLNTGLKARIGREGGLEASCLLLNPPLNILVQNLVKPLKVSFGVVCSVESNGKYLKVSPYDIQWITPDSDIVFIVKSNVDWEIETN